MAICIMNQNSATRDLERHAETAAENAELRDRHEAVHADLPCGERQGVGLDRLRRALGRAERSRIGVMVKYWKATPKAKAKTKSRIQTANIFSANSVCQPNQTAIAGHGEGEPFGDDVAERATAAAMRCALRDHDRKRRPVLSGHPCARASPHGLRLRA